MTTALAPLEQPATDTNHGDPDIIHWTCNVHILLAFCGKKLAPDDPEASDDEEVDCPLCVLADEQGVVCAIPGCPGQRRRIPSWLRRLVGAS